MIKRDVIFLLKLNNKGWGLSNMIIFIVILLLFMIIFLIVAYNYGIEKDSPNSLYEQFIIQ